MSIIYSIEIGLQSQIRLEGLGGLLAYIKWNKCKITRKPIDMHPKYRNIGTLFTLVIFKGVKEIYEIGCYRRPGGKWKNLSQIWST